MWRQSNHVFLIRDLISELLWQFCQCKRRTEIAHINKRYISMEKGGRGSGWKTGLTPCCLRQPVEAWGSLSQSWTNISWLYQITASQMLKALTNRLPRAKTPHVLHLCLYFRDACSPWPSVGSWYLLWVDQLCEYAHVRSTKENCFHELILSHKFGFNIDIVFTAREKIQEFWVSRL